VWADPELAPAGTELLNEFGRMSASLLVDRARSIGETTHLARCHHFEPVWRLMPAARAAAVIVSRLERDRRAIGGRAGSAEH